MISNRNSCSNLETLFAETEKSLECHPLWLTVYDGDMILRRKNDVADDDECVPHDRLKEGRERERFHGVPPKLFAGILPVASKIAGCGCIKGLGWLCCDFALPR